MDDRNNPEGTAELSVDDAVSLLTANSSDEEQSPLQAETETSEPETEEAEDEAKADPEGDEDDGEDEAEEVDDDASSEADDAFELDLDAVIEIDGEQTTLKELREGAMRQSDFTRSKQQLAEERKAFEAERAAIEEERARYAQSLAEMEQRLQAEAEQEPDWDKLFEEDPLEYVRLNKVWQDKKEARQRLAQEREALRQRDAVEAQRRQAQAMEEGRAQLLERIPEWQNPEVAAKESRELTEFLLERGYSPDQIQRVSPTDILFAREAMMAIKTTKSTETAKKKVQNKPKVIKAKGSKPASEGKKARVRKQMAKLERTGSIEDALPLMFQ